MDTRVAALEGSVQEIQSSVATIGSTMQNLSTVIASMESRFAALEFHFSGADRPHRAPGDLGNSSNPMGSSEETLSDRVDHMGQRFFRQDSSFHPRPPLIKLEFPRFSDGDDPLAWVYRAEHYFDYFSVDDAQKVRMASFHMDNEALQWFQWRNCIKNHLTWADFVHVFCKEFGPSEFEDFTEALVQLKQLGSLKEYVSEFRRLANRTTEIGPVMLRGCFIGGLKPELRHDVKLLRPSDVHEAIALAFQVDIKLSDTKVRNFSRNSVSSFSNATNSKSVPLLSGSNFSSSTSRASNMRKMSFEEIQDRRKKGLCYSCPEKWVRGHVCATQQLLLLDVSADRIEDFDGEDCDDQQVEITACAVFGSSAPQHIQTMKVSGLIKNCPVIVLLDSGSSHNFISLSVAKQLGWKVDSKHSFEVMIANGGTIASKGCCSQIKLQIQQYEYISDFYVLQLGGCDVVLGAQWLRTLGPILWDFDKLKMEFTLGKKHYCISSSPPPPAPTSISTCQVEKLLSQGPFGVVLFFLEPETQVAIVGDLTVLQETELEGLLSRFASVFQAPTTLPPSRSHDHRIPLLEGSKPPSARPYRYGPLQKSEIEKCVQELLDSGFIRASNSSFSSPVLLVKKKDNSWRMCMDYRALNLITIKDKYPIPIIDELLDELFGAQFFSKLDLRAGYHQIRVHTSDIEKTAFRTHDGHYEFLVMPFGLTNAPATFQSLMNEIFRPYLRKFVLVFFDDILVYSDSWESHLHHLSLVFKVLQDHQLFVKRTKCDFGKSQIEYLGHVVSRQGVAADPSKLQSIQDWPLPHSVKALRGFLGLTGYYRKFILNYRKICGPLTALTKKDAFKWTDEATRAFQALKDLMVSPHVLALPDFSKPFIIETDASNNGLGAVLHQDGRPIAFTSKALGPRAQAMSTYEREMLAIVHAIKKWQSYIQGRHFGCDNVAADALSRLHSDGELSAISYPYMGWLDDIRRHNEQDPWIMEKIRELPADGASSSTARYHFDNGFLKYNGRIVLSPSSGWRDKIFYEHHCTPVWVAACSVCQQNKTETLASPGLLNPLPIPSTVWTDIAMDFIIGLPPCKGKTIIFVVVDRLSKYAHFLPMSHPYTAHSVAQIFVDHIFKLHGMPSTIVSDRDPVFLSSFWKAFFTLNGSKLCLSSGYHPQTDGQTEVTNRGLETYLRCFCSHQPKKWVHWLPWAEWHYNTTFHTSSKLTPYEVVYGQPPPAVPTYESGATKIDLVNRSLEERGRILSQLKTNLLSAQVRMKQQADKHRTERSFEVGDMRLVPYQHQSLAKHPFHKLQPRFYGPFKVLQKIGHVAYKIDLPTTSKLHPVFHVSCLKKQLGSDIIPAVPLPVVIEDGLLEDYPLAILRRRLTGQGSSSKTGVLVQWQHRPKEDATWENYAEFVNRFPAFQP
nr:uncharacterized protein LOC108169704 [Malus domestica]